MSYDIAEKAREAQANYQAALVRLNTARTAYEQGAGGAYAAAKAQRELLERKIQEAQDEADRATDAYQQAFAAGNFEKTAAVRDALARKHEAEGLGAALRDALSKNAQDMQRHLLEASTQGREYVAAHSGAYSAYVRAQALAALAGGGEAIARTLALATAIPVAGGYWEKEFGEQGALPESLERERDANRQDGILETLRYMARQYPARAHVAEIGPLELGALQERELLTTVQQLKARRAIGAEV